MGYAPPVSRRGSIEALRVKRTDDGDWYAEIDYEYSGMQEAGHLVGQLLVEPGSRSADALQPRVFAVRPALPGRRTARIDIERPPAEMAPLRTSGVRVELRNGGTIAASQDVAQVIEWPSFEAWAQERELASRTPQENFRRAVELIDRGDGQALGDAKRLLERLIVKDPKFDAGFVELAW
jgi:hypothetical protein